VGLFVLMLFSDDKKRNIGRIFISGIGVFVGYIPWLIVLFGQLKAVGNEYWIDRIGRSACIQIMEFPFGDNATPWDMACFLVLVIAVIFSLISLIGILRNKEVKIAFFALSILALTVITGVVVSRIFRPVFVPRYMIPTLLCFWFGIVWLTKEAGAIRKNIIVLMLIAGGLYSFLNLCWDEFLLKHQVHRMLDTIEITTENENIYVTDSRHIHHILQQYCEGKNQVYLVKEAEDWKQIEDFDNIRYAVALKDDFLESEIGSSWDNLGECRLEVYDTVVYEK